MGIRRMDASAYDHEFHATGSRPLDYFYGIDNNYTNWYMLHGGGAKTTMPRDSTVYIGICKVAINIGDDVYIFVGSRTFETIFKLTQHHLP